MRSFLELNRWDRHPDGTEETDSYPLSFPAINLQHNHEAASDASSLLTYGSALVELSETHSENTNTNQNTRDVRMKIQHQNIALRGSNAENPSAFVFLGESDITEYNHDPRPNTPSDCSGWPTRHNGELPLSWRRYCDRSSVRPAVMTSARGCNQINENCYEVDLTEFPWSSGNIDWV